MRITGNLARLIGRGLKWYVASYRCAVPGHDGCAPSQDIIEGNLRSAIIKAEASCPPGFEVEAVVRMGTAEQYVKRCIADAEWGDA